MSLLLLYNDEAIESTFKVFTMSLLLVMYDDEAIEFYNELVKSHVFTEM